LVSNVGEGSHKRGIFSGGSSTSRPENSGPLVGENGEPVIFYHGTKDTIRLRDVDLQPELMVLKSGELFKLIVEGFDEPLICRKLN
jgi:hypothetical protein